MDELKSWGLAKTMDSQWESIKYQLFEDFCSAKLFEVVFVQFQIQQTRIWLLCSMTFGTAGFSSQIRSAESNSKKLCQFQLVRARKPTQNDQTFQAGEISIAHRKLSRSDSIHACPIGLKTYRADGPNSGCLNSHRNFVGLNSLILWCYFTWNILWIKQMHCQVCRNRRELQLYCPGCTLKKYGEKGPSNQPITQ